MKAEAGGCQAQVRFGERHRQHSAGGDFVEQRAAQVDQADAVFKADHPGQGGGGVFAHRMADQQRRCHAPGHEQPGEGIFDDHDQRQLHRGALQPVRRCRLVARFGQPQRPDVIGQFRLQNGEAPVHPVGEHRLGRIQIAGHAGVLRAAAGEHEHHLGTGTQMVMVENLARVGPFQQRRRLFMAFRHQHPPLVKGAAALLQRIGHIGQRLFGMRPQMRRQPRRRGLQRRFRPRRQHQRLKWPDSCARHRPRRSLFQHHMRIGAANPQRVHPGPQHIALPVGQPVIHPERRCLKINRRVRAVIAQRRRQLPMVQRQRHLDQARHPRRRVQMPDVGFHRADPAGAHGIRRFPKRRRQRRNLDRVAQRGAGAVAFDIADLIRGHPGHRLRLGNRLGLTIH